MRITAFSLVIFFALLSTSAQASPPQVISVDESLISVGGSGGFLFILRTLTDNMGHHGVQQTDTVLIARSRGTNQDVYLWPISRTIDNGPDHVETQGSPRIVNLPVEGNYNPSLIAYQHHGGIANEWVADDSSGIEVLENADGVLITAKTPSFAYEAPEGTPPRTSYWLSYNRLAVLVEDSLRDTRYSFTPHYLEGSDPLTRPEFDPKHDCKFDYFAEISEQTDGEQQGFWVAKVACESDITLAPVSMFITLQPLPY